MENDHVLSYQKKTFQDAVYKVTIKVKAEGVQVGSTTVSLPEETQYRD